ncbi:MAG: hypothetical protein EBS68_10875 [Rhodobacteraceae bacterium]|nr:hypothetical protein [Paracoccaceae bacterium]
MSYDEFIDDLFMACVHLLEWGAPKIGMTYNEINIWLFVIIHPLLTLLFMVLWLRARKRG